MTASITTEEILPGSPVVPRARMIGFDYSALVHAKDPVPRYSLVMRDVIYEDCNFYDTSFYTSELTNVSFKGCNFQRAEFNMTSLYNCQFTNCDIALADLCNSELHHTTFINTPLHATRLFHALVPDSLLLPTGYVRDRKHNAPANPSLVIYDPLWVASLPRLTGASRAAVNLFLEEHTGETPTLITAMLRALSH